jgi:hypothetical protein
VYVREVNNRPEVRPIAATSKTPLESFKIFITDEMIDAIVNYTNQRIIPKIEAINNNAKAKKIMLIFI